MLILLCRFNNRNIYVCNATNQEVLALHWSLYLNANFVKYLMEIVAMMQPIFPKKAINDEVFLVFNTKSARQFWWKLFNVQKSGICFKSKIKQIQAVYCFILTVLFQYPFPNTLDIISMGIFVRKFVTTIIV